MECEEYASSTNTHLLKLHCVLTVTQWVTVQVDYDYKFSNTIACNQQHTRTSGTNKRKLLAPY